MTFRTSPPNHPLTPTGRSERQVCNVKFGKIGVRGFYIIMRARHERVKIYLSSNKTKVAIKFPKKNFFFFPDENQLFSLTKISLALKRLIFSVE